MDPVIQDTLFFSVSDLQGPFYKTVSLPQWLYEMACEKGISLSKTLQKALKDELGIN